MSIFNAELLPKISAISIAYIKSFNDELKDVFGVFDKFEEKFQNGRNKAREKPQKDKLGMTTLQSITEDEDPEPPKSAPEPDQTSAKSDSSTTSNERASKKRSKNEVDGILSPEQDKRQKRNASVKAQAIISKQVNVNLTQKLRREKSEDKLYKNKSKNQRQNDDEKENTEPNDIIPILQLKQEKISLPLEPMETEPLPVNIDIKQENNKDDIAMPPPMAPVPKPRKAIQKEKSDVSDEDNSSNKRSTTNKKQNDMPPPPVPSARSTRASNRARQTDIDDQPPTEARPKRTRAKKKTSEEKESLQDNISESSRSTRSSNMDQPPPEPRPKRTRAKKKASLTPKKDSDKENVSAASSPAEKPRPKRTRRNKKAAEKLETETQEIQLTLKQERISTKIDSPILQKDVKPKKGKINPIPIEIEASLREKHGKTEINQVNTLIINNTINIVSEDKVDLAMDETRIISKDMDKTMVLPNRVYDHTPVTPKAVQTMNETVVIEKINNETVVLDKPTKIMDATVVLDKGPKEANITDDNSLLTEDADSIPPHPSPSRTPSPSHTPPLPQPTSAVKEKVQQFEELASRVTRTKTRAMAKKDEQTDKQTSPEKTKPVISAETLNKMNNLIFNNRKPPLVSSSATKPKAIPVKIVVPSSTSKLTARRNTDVEEKQTSHKVEDPRQKKEAMLEAKREQQRRKREEKMAAAAAARLAAEKERALAASLAARERQDKMDNARAGHLARQKEAERKKQEYARKVAETEERRRAEENARVQRLAEEQKRAEAQRKKQLEEQLQMKKEEARMAREIEKRQKEYIEKQKLKQRMEDKCHTPLRAPPPPAPVYMQDGFQYLDSDEDADPPPRPVPAWSTSQARRHHLEFQSRVSSIHIDRLFSVRVHNPDVRELFPNIERNMLKRTSSAVWRTPPHLPPVQE